MEIGLGELHFEYYWVAVSVRADGRAQRVFQAFREFFPRKLP